MKEVEVATVEGVGQGVGLLFNERGGRIRVLPNGAK